MTIKELFAFFEKFAFDEEALRANHARILALPIYDVGALDTRGQINGTPDQEPVSEGFIKVFCEKREHHVRLMKFAGNSQGHNLSVRYEDLFTFERLLKVLKFAGMPYALEIKTILLRSGSEYCETLYRDFAKEESQIIEDVRTVWWIHAQMFAGYAGFELFNPFARPATEDEVSEYRIRVSDFLRFSRQCELLRDYCTAI